MWSSVTDRADLKGRDGMLREDIMHELARVFDGTGNVLIGAALAQIATDGAKIEALEKSRVKEGQADG